MLVETCQGQDPRIYNLENNLFVQLSLLHNTIVSCSEEVTKDSHSERSEKKKLYTSIMHMQGKQKQVLQVE